MTHKLRVGVIFGGRSGEHEVSLASAQSMMAAMDHSKYDIVPIGITKEGRWIVQGDPLAALQAGDAGALPTAALLGDPSQHGLMRISPAGSDDVTCTGTLQLQLARLEALDVIFPVLHGPYGEDGTLQGLLELANIPYVGAGVLGSAVGMDKIIFKRICEATGLPIVAYVALGRKEWQRDPSGTLAQVEACLGYPMFTKPANLGSSVGISKCRDRDELAEGLAEAARYDRKLVVEAAVAQAREIEVSVLGNDEPMASVPGEIIPSREFYSYEAKYVDQGEDASQLLIPAPISPEIARRAQELAVRAYLAIDCAGMARADFLLSGATGGLYVNELNTIPGFTAISMYPKLWEASGVSYPELIDRLIELALERQQDKEHSETSYQPRVD
jgi:D-alanine-D-alanine ligase